MIRKIIEIDREKCNGCGACATACHEGAIAMVDGKAQLMREDYCDGLGDCLPAPPGPLPLSPGRPRPMTRPPSARQSNPVVHRPAGSPSGRCRFAWSRRRPPTLPMQIC